MNRAALDACLSTTFENFGHRVHEHGAQAVGKQLEEIIRTLYQNILNPGDTAVDVGANYGLHTLPMAQCVGAQGRVLAFEPIPEVRKALTERIAKADLSSIVAVKEAALSDHTGAAEFTVVVEDVGYSGLREQNYRFATEKRVIQVQVDCLDRHAGEAGPIRFVKIDVEGGEFHVLRGARKILRTHRPTVVFESAKQESARNYGYTKEDLFGFFAGVDYELRDILGCPFLMDHWSLTGPWYVVAVPKEGASLLSTALSAAVARQILELRW